MKLFNEVALEENDSVLSKETEIVIYAKITSFDELDKADKVIKQEQIEGKFSKGQKCRVRKSTEDDKDEYEFTFKLKGSGENTKAQVNTEYNIDVDKDFFEGFKQVAEKFVIKTRYVFSSKSVELTYTENDEKKNVEVPDVNYEVDVYQKPDGSLSEWCKIDIEIDNIMNFLSKEHPELENITLSIKISHLPFGPVEPILVSSATEEQHKFMSDLWDNEYNHKL